LRPLPDARIGSSSVLSECGPALDGRCAQGVEEGRITRVLIGAVEVIPLAGLAQQAEDAVADLAHQVLDIGVRDLARGMEVGSLPERACEHPVGPIFRQRAIPRSRVAAWLV
jgi:hypothetical protein